MVEPLAVATFTLLPLLALGAGIALTVWGAMVLERWLLIASLLFTLMAAHQLTEVGVLLAGGNPLGNTLGELFETGVNLLAVLTVAGLVWLTHAERRKRERQELLTRALDTGPILGTPRETGVTHSSLLGPTGVQLPVLGRLASWAFATLPLGATATLPTVIETAVRNLQVTYPSTTVDRDGIPEHTVYGEATTLAEILETILKRRVLYNDSSEPEIRIQVETDGPAVIVQISDNGPAFPPAADSGAGNGIGAGPDLGPAQTLLEQWGGSIHSTDSAVELRLRRPNSRPIGDPD